MIGLRSVTYAYKYVPIVLDTAQQISSASEMKQGQSLYRTITEDGYTAYETLSCSHSSFYIKCMRFDHKMGAVERKVTI